jgi:Flp pilus assembly protein TadD
VISVILQGENSSGTFAENKTLKPKDQGVTMDPLVQSAREAFHQGDKSKARDLLKQALGTNPNDIEVWLLLANVVDEPQRKRQCLNRVLSLEATNKTAREMLLEMDRAELNSYRTQPRPATLPTAQSQPETPRL